MAQNNFPGPPRARTAQQRNTAMGGPEDGQPQPSDQASGFGNFFGGLASLFTVENAPGSGAAVPQVPEQTETYLPSLDYKKKFQGKSVLLTGATGAVGAATARKLLKCNLRKLVLFVKEQDKLDDKIVEALSMNEYQGILYVETLDLREPQRIEQRFQNAMLRDFGGILDTVILCHGIVVQKGLTTCTIPQYDQSMLVNVRSMMHLVSLATPFLKVQKKSSITILTSSQGSHPDPNSPVMCIGAAMVHQLIKCAALETAYHGVRINGVAAGPILSTSRTNQDLCAMQLSEEENQVFLEEKAQQCPLGQLNNPTEIAETLLFLASEDASFCTGEIMVVDGGQSLTSDYYQEYDAKARSVFQNRQ